MRLRRVLRGPCAGALLLTLLVGTLQPARADEAGALQALRLRQLVESREFRKALALLEEKLAQESAGAEVYAEAARCAFGAGLYDRVIELAKQGRQALQRLEEQTDATRELSRNLTRLESEVRRIRQVRDRFIPEIVGHLVRSLPYVHTWFIKDRSRYLADEVFKPPDESTRMLKDEFVSPHYMVLFSRYTSVDPIIAMIESYPDEAVARERFAWTQRMIVAQRPRWERHFRVNRKLQGYKLVEAAEGRDPYRDATNWVLARTDYTWRGKAGDRPFEVPQAKVMLVQILEEGQERPAPEAWFHVLTVLDSNQMKWVSGK